MLDFKSIDALSIFNYDDFINKMKDIDKQKEDTFEDFKKSFQIDVEDILEKYTDKKVTKYTQSYFCIDDYFIVYSFNKYDSSYNELRGSIGCHKRTTLDYLYSNVLVSTDEDLENKIKNFVAECRNKIIEKEAKKFNI